VEDRKYEAWKNNRVREPDYKPGEDLSFEGYAKELAERKRIREQYADAFSETEKKNSWWDWGDEGTAPVSFSDALGCGCLSGCLSQLFRPFIVVPQALFRSVTNQRSPYDPSLHAYSGIFGLVLAVGGLFCIVIGFAVGSFGSVMLGIMFVIIAGVLFKKYGGWKVLMEERGYVLRQLDLGRATASTDQTMANLQIELARIAKESSAQSHEKWLHLITMTKELSQDMVKHVGTNPRYEDAMAEVGRLMERIKTSTGSEADAEFAEGVVNRIRGLLFTKATGVRIDDI
jgi:hypothetical protein